MIRAVLDTNVVVSALVFRGVANLLVRAWQEPRLMPLVSDMLLKEYIRVLHYAKLHLNQSDIRYLIEEELMPFVTPVQVKAVPRVVSNDPSDNHGLACAIAGKADVIVTGDHHLLELGRYKAIPIVTIPAFLQRLEKVP